MVRHPQFRGVGAYETTTDLLRGNDPPTALFTSQNLISIGAVRALHDLGLQHEVAMVGFDDVVLADAVDPGSRSSPRTRSGWAAGRRSCCSSALDGYDGPSRHGRASRPR